MLSQEVTMPERLDPVVPADRDMWWEETAHLWRYFWAASLKLPEGVIDAACGTGYGTSILRAYGHAATGLDRDPDAISLAHRRWSYGFIVGDMESFTFEGWGTLVSFETIEHLTRPVVFLGKLRTTTLLASVPIVPTIHYNPHHRHDFTRLSFHVMLKSAGWKIEEEHLQSHPTRTNVYCVVRCAR